MLNRLSPRFRDSFEVISGYGLILVTIWTPMPLQRVLFWITFAWIIAVTIRRNESLSAMSLTWAGALRSLWIVPVTLLLSCLSLWAAERSGTLHPLFARNVPLGLRVVGYVVWAIMQQFILQVYMLQRLLRLFPHRFVAIGIAALLFAAAHIPNPVLTGLTLLWGIIACVLYLRYRNLYTLGLAHGILGLCVAITVPDSLNHHMRVGVGYITYQQHVDVWATHSSRSTQ